MKNVYIIFVSFILIINIRCFGSKTEKENGVTDLSLAIGFQLMEKNCFSCHSPNALNENNVGPTMALIKSHYAAVSISEKEFIQNFITFLNNPSESASKMPDAIKQYGLMPKMSFSEEQINIMAKYVYRTPLENPDWYEKYYALEKNKYSTHSEELTPIEMGKQFAMQTKGVLGKNLLNAIKTKGVENALEFCSVNAIGLTDSVAQSLDAKIKRVSDKNRNPENAASEVELKYIFYVKELLARNEKPIPQITEKDDRWIAYYPILMDQMCLQCHGKQNTEILPKTLSKIHELYPDDKATGYKLNELRGIWVVDMKK